MIHMQGLTVNLKTKQTISSKVGFYFILLIHRFRFLSDKRAVRLINFFLSRGAFKYRINKSDWVPLEIEAVLRERK